MLPPSLKPNATIGIYSPSSPATHFAPKRTERAISYLESKGFRVVCGSLTGKADHYRAGNIQQRADELNALIRDPKIDCIMSTIGGANSNSLLPYIDFETLKKRPKIWVGYSDATAILLAVYAKTGCTVYYGPALTASFGEFPPLVDVTFDAFKSVALQAERPLQVQLPSEWTDEMIPWEEQTQPKTLEANTVVFEGTGSVSGRLIGGNLNTITAIWGSQYMPPILDGDILLIEDAMKDIATVERLFAFLKLNQVFEKVKAVILGKHELFDDAGTGRAPIDVLREVMAETKLPLIYDFDCAHTHPMLTMPIGQNIEINFDKQTRSLID